MEDIKTVSDYITKLADTNYYGKLTLSFEGGRIVNLKKEETLKLYELRKAK